MPIPDYQTLMLPVLRLAAMGETRIPDVQARLAETYSLSAAEREQFLPSGRQNLFYNRIAWAKFYMSKAGLIGTPKRGRFVATEAGRALLAKNPERIDIDCLLGYPAFQEFRGRDVANDVAQNGGLLNSKVEVTKTPEE